MKSNEFKLVLAEMEKRLSEQMADLHEANRELIRELNERDEEGAGYVHAQPQIPIEQEVRQGTGEHFTPSIMPRMGISHSAFELFDAIPDPVDRNEYMIRYTQMEYAQSRKEWMVWAAYAQMLIEGMLNRSLLRLASQVSSSSKEEHVFAYLVSLFDAYSKRKKVYNQPEEVKKIGGHHRKYEQQLQDRELGWHNNTSSFHRVKEHIFYRIVTYDLIAPNEVSFQLVDFSGDEVVCTIEFHGESSGMFGHVDAAGIFFPKAYIGDIDGMKINLNEVLFLMGPLPIGRGKPRNKSGYLSREIEISPKTKVTYSTLFETFEQWKGARVYRIDYRAVGKSFAYVNLRNLSRKDDYERFDVLEVPTKDRLILFAYLFGLVDSSFEVELKRLVPSSWWDYCKSDCFDSIELLTGLRNRYCHMGSLNIQFEEVISDLFDAVQSLIIGGAAVLAERPVEGLGAVLLRPTEQGARSFGSAEKH